MLEESKGAHRALSRYDFELSFCSCLNDTSSLKEEEHVVNTCISPQSQGKVTVYVGLMVGSWRAWRICVLSRHLESRNIRRKEGSSYVTEVSLYNEYQLPLKPALVYKLSGCYKNLECLNIKVK